mmetsp:Transcript_22266/g.45185  ORF Transcript_22266/g.45185 Transcript_22266/m.45185 type:complete len:222 (+) Transcript_22266:220-885(+)
MRRRKIHPSAAAVVLLLPWLIQSVPRECCTRVRSLPLLLPHEPRNVHPVLYPRLWITDPAAVFVPRGGWQTGEAIRLPTSLPQSRGGIASTINSSSNNNNNSIDPGNRNQHERRGTLVLRLILLRPWRISKTCPKNKSTSCSWTIRNCTKLLSKRRKRGERQAQRHHRRRPSEPKKLVVQPARNQVVAARRGRNAAVAVPNRRRSSSNNSKTEKFPIFNGC